MFDTQVDDVRNKAVLVADANEAHDLRQTSLDTAQLGLSFHSKVELHSDVGRCERFLSSDVFQKML